MPFKKGNQYGKNGKGNLKHGLCGTRIYQCWGDMKQRCNNEANAFYHRYGGRGVSYTKDWEEFMPFYEWAMANGYRDDLTLDRIDNDGDYTPENCKWSTQHEQSMNKTHLQSKTGVVGVRWKANRYQAEICRYGEYHYIGRYETLEEAKAARDAALEALNVHRRGLS